MNIKQEVLTELSQLVIVNNTACIVRQLDRKQYLAVNEVLEALGGKWDRKAKAHVFKEDPTPRIDAAITTGEVMTAQDLGFFPTPPALAAQLVTEYGDVQRGHMVLEPSAGDGAIAMAALDRGAHVFCIEYDPRRRATLANNLARHNAMLQRLGAGGDYEIAIELTSDHFDFMTYEPDEPFDRVVMNPPFCKVGESDHIGHVAHAYNMLADDGVLVSVLPAGVLFREDKRHAMFRSFCQKWGTLEPLPVGSFKSSGTDVNTCVARLVKR